MPDVLGTVSRLHAAARNLLREKRLDRVEVPEDKFSKFKEELEKNGFTLVPTTNDGRYLLKGVPVIVKKEHFFGEAALAAMFFAFKNSEGTFDFDIKVIPDAK